MNNLNKVLAIIAAGIILSGLTGCNKNTSSVIANKPKSVSIKSEADNKINLTKLKFTLPENWVKRVNENEIFFDDKNKQTVGGISLIGYYGDYDASLPNHSKILNTDEIDTSLGKGTLFALERSNPAAANSSQVWNEIHAIIPVNQSNLAYDIWIKGTKNTIINILKSFH